MKTRRKFLWVALCVAVCGAGLFAAALPNEMQGEKELDRLQSDDIPKTEVLRVELKVARRADSCLIFTAVVLATEMSVEELAPRFASRAHGLAWAAPGRFPASTPEGVEMEAPKGAVALLTQWAIVPDSVRRVVVFREVPAKSRWDVRCWNLTSSS